MEGEASVRVKKQEIIYVTPTNTLVQARGAESGRHHVSGNDVASVNSHGP
jgi:hypothetical protein